MSRILLDTSGYSAFKKGSAEAIGAVRAADEIYINAIVLGELAAGFLRGSRRQNLKFLYCFLEHAFTQARLRACHAAATEFPVQISRRPTASGPF